ncbi:MAG: pyruvate kinase alpha/beta domain-containing protein [Planctomycetota bacterium]|nr:pyruvate kinase alpha/beta domain-containing protein [Planctomycetota bacterium]
MYFDEFGPKNTETTLKLAFERAVKDGVKHVVIASTTGRTAKRAVELAAGQGLQLVFVTHNTGFAKPGEQEFSAEIRREVEAAGARVLTGTATLRGIGAAIKARCGSSEEEIVRSTLRMFCQGTKVCLEMAAMVSDAGLVPPGDIIAVAGTGKGSDTILKIHAQPSNQFFDMKVREVIAKPRNF